MHESLNTGKLIVNMVKTERGTHVLFQGFGLQTTDDIAPLTRGAVQTAVSTYYPGVSIKRLSTGGRDIRGHQEIEIELV